VHGIDFENRRGLRVGGLLKNKPRLEWPGFFLSLAKPPPVARSARLGQQRLDANEIRPGCSAQHPLLPSGDRGVGAETCSRLRLTFVSRGRAVGVRPRLSSAHRCGNPCWMIKPSAAPFNRTRGLAMRPYPRWKNHSTRARRIDRRARSIFGMAPGWRGRAIFKRSASASHRPSPNPQTANAQQRRRRKALMRHAAASGFPSTRAALLGLRQLRENPGAEDGGRNFGTRGSFREPPPNL